MWHNLAQLPRYRGLIQSLVARERMERVLDVVGRLRGIQRDAVVMHYIEQESFQSIARQLNRSPHQVRALCHKGIRQLRNRLAADRAFQYQEEQPRGKN